MIKRCEDLIKKGSAPPPGVMVGVITPYRSQIKCLKNAFVRVLGQDIASEVKFMTVDSCQGKQLDVVILVLCPSFIQVFWRGVRC